jgi:hypothetical protein
MTINPPETAPVPGLCKRPGCGSPLPEQGRGRSRQFCSRDCASRYSNGLRIPAAAAAPADSTADPLAALDALLRQAVQLARAGREQAAGLDPARVRAQIAEAEAARRQAEAAAVTAAARAAEALAETQALAEALDAARDDVRAAKAAQAAALDQAAAAAGALEHAQADATVQTADARSAAAAQVTDARAETGRAIRERDDATEAARRADAEVTRARQAETDARTETERARADAARERDTLQAQHHAQLEAVAALTAAERDRAQRAEQLLETERADRRQLTTHLTAAGNSNGSGRPARAAAGKAGQQ